MINIFKLIKGVINGTDTISKINLGFYFLFLIGLITLIVGAIVGSDPVMIVAAIMIFLGVIPPVGINTVRHFFDKEDKFNHEA